MSYTIIFFKYKRGSIEEQERFLEGEGVTRKDRIFIKARDELLANLKALESTVQVYQTSQQAELTFSFCQIGFYKTQIGLSISYG